MNFLESEVKKIREANRALGLPITHSARIDVYKV